MQEAVAALFNPIVSYQARRDALLDAFYELAERREEGSILAAFAYEVHHCNSVNGEYIVQVIDLLAWWTREGEESLLCRILDENVQSTDFKQWTPYQTALQHSVRHHYVMRALLFKMDGVTYRIPETKGAQEAITRIVGPLLDNDGSIELLHDLFAYDGLIQVCLVNVPDVMTVWTKTIPRLIKSYKLEGIPSKLREFIASRRPDYGTLSLINKLLEKKGDYPIDYDDELTCAQRDEVEFESDAIETEDMEEDDVQNQLYERYFNH
jgi:hypothetical protein